MKNIFKTLAVCGLALFATACGEDEKQEPDYTPAELKSVAFYAADNAGVLTEDYEVAQIADEMVVRIPEGGKGKTLVMSLTAGENDIIKVDGKEISGKATVDASYPIDIIVTNTKSNLSKTYVVKVGKVLETVFEHIFSYKEPDCTITNLSMAINPKDNAPYLFYIRKATGESINKGSVIKWNGASFDALGSLGFTGEKAVGALGMNFDKDGVPYISYADNNEGYLMTVKKFTSGNWETVGKAGSCEKVNNSYITNMFFNPTTNLPVVLYSVNDRTSALYRTMVSASFDGSEWNLSKVPVAPDINGTAGVHVCSDAIKIGNTIYVAATFTSLGYYIFKFENGSWSSVVDGFFTGTLAHASCINIFADNEQNIYIMAGDNSAESGKWDMQIYKLDEANKTMTKYGNTVTVGFGSLRETMAAAANPVTGEIVGIYKNMDDDIIMGSCINSNIQWNDFTQLSPKIANNSAAVRILYTADGVGYAAFVAKDEGTIELFRIGKEADVLPE